MRVNKKILQQAKEHATSTYEQDGNVASYGFGGAVTTTSQGNPVAIIYGEREVGGAIGSAGIYGEDQV